MLSDPGILAVIIGTFFGFVVLTVVEVVVLQLLKLGEKPKTIFFSLCANLAGLFSVVVGVVFLIALWGIGLIVAMDKGYDSGEKFLTLGTASFLLVPVLIIALRFILLLLFKITNGGRAFVYALVSTIVSAVLLAVINFFFVLTASMLS